jgi:hypothetical protein
VAEQISLELSDPDLALVKLCFDRMPDRWAHRWRLLEGDQDTTWMRSVEGTPEQDWPPSPPLQDVNQLEPGTGNSILAVGMAGRSHWSASYSIERTSDGTPFLKADLACLQKDKSETASKPSLGSTYQLGSECTVESVSETTVKLRVSANSWIVLEASQDADCTTAFQVQDQTLSVIPQQFSSRPDRATRWAFHVIVLA